METKTKIRYQRVCSTCRTPFATFTIRKKYCKDSCRVLSHLRRAKTPADKLKTEIRIFLMTGSIEKLEELIEIVRRPDA